MQNKALLPLAHFHPPMSMKDMGKETLKYVRFYKTLTYWLAFEK